MESQKFERLGVFAYSREEGTVAGDMENQIDEEIKQARADSIMRRQMDISREVNEEKVGRIFEVLVDGQDEEGAYIGLSLIHILRELSIGHTTISVPPRMMSCFVLVLFQII